MLAANQPISAIGANARSGRNGIRSIPGIRVIAKITSEMNSAL